MTAEQLEELLGKVTQGEWRLEEDSTCVWGDCNEDDASDRGMGYPIAAARISPASSWARGPHIVEGVANATLIALAPSLARRVIAAEKMRVAFEIMEKHGALGNFQKDALNAYREDSK